MGTYTPLITAEGRQLIAESIANDTPIVLKYFAWGDSNGVLTSPAEIQTSLINEVYRQTITSVSTNAQNPSWLEVVAVIPSNVGGFTVREVGIFTDNNILFCVAAHPEFVKSTPTDGTAIDFREKFIIEITNLSQVTIEVDASTAFLSVADLTNHHHTGIGTQPSQVLLTGGTEVQGTLPASMVEDVFVKKSGSTMTGTLSFSGGVGISGLPLPVANGQPVVYEQLSTFNAVPTGAVFYFPSATIPSGFLFCDGRAISRTTYSNLFAILGTIYGTGDGTTTFNLPDLRGVFIRGLDNARGIDSSRVLGSYQDYATARPQTRSRNRLSYDGTKSAVSGNGELLGFAGVTNPGEGWTANVADAADSGIQMNITAVFDGDSETRPKNIALIPLIKI